jgi:hypothetical protein
MRVVDGKITELFHIEEPRKLKLTLQISSGASLGVRSGAIPWLPADLLTC